MVKPYMISTEDLDYELRLIMWACVSRSCSRSPEIMRQAAHAGFAKVLLMFVSLKEGAAVQRWNSDQLTTLRGAALSRLYEVSKPGGCLILICLLVSPNLASPFQAHHLHNLASPLQG